MDTKLFQIYEKALKNDPEAILTFGEHLRLGKGIKKDINIAAEWYEKLLHFNDFNYTNDYITHYWGAIAASNKENFRLAKRRLKKCYKLMVETIDSTEEFTIAMDSLNFYSWFGYITLMAELNLPRI